MTVPNFSIPSEGFGSRPKDAANPDRSHWIPKINSWLTRAWDSGWSSRPHLCPEEILRQGVVGLSSFDFPDRSEWLDRLNDLVAALRTQALLNPLGETIAYGQLVRTVRQRIKLELLWREKPEILAIRVPPPMIIIGQMRSGTTRMQRMLASDPGMSATRFCDSWHPLPPQGIDWRPLKAWASLKAVTITNPYFSVIHPTSPCAVDEEIGWLGLGFSTTPFDAQWHIPSFVAANRKRDAISTYTLMKKLLQTDQWAKRDMRPRVLKVPQFMEDFEALIATFPDARIVHVKREATSVVASSSSLVANQRVIQSDHVDMVAIGREWLDRTVRRDLAATKFLEPNSYPVAEVEFTAMDECWQVVMRDLYHRLDMPWTDSLLPGMQRSWIKPPTPRGAHGYSLSDFGLTEAQIWQALGAGTKQILYQPSKAY